MMITRRFLRIPYMNLPGAALHVMIAVLLALSVVPITAVKGGFLAQLGILSQPMVSILPVLSGISYLLVTAIASHFVPKSRSIPPVVGFLMAAPLGMLPDWIYRATATEIHLNGVPRMGLDFVPAPVIAEFEVRFNTRALQLCSLDKPDPTLVVPSGRYSDRMKDVISEIAARHVEESLKYKEAISGNPD